MGDDRETPPEPLRPRRPDGRYRTVTAQTAVAPPGPGNKLPPRPTPRVDLDDTQESAPEPRRYPSPPPRNEPVVPSSEVGERLVQLAEEREARREAERRAAELEEVLRRERRKGPVAADSEPPQANGDKALGRAVRSAAGWLLSIVLAGGSGAGVAHYRAAPPERVDATAARVSALEARALKCEDEQARTRAIQAKQDQFNRSAAAWIALLAERQQIRARQADSAPPPVGIVPERMPSDRARAGPLWRAEQELPVPP